MRVPLGFVSVCLSLWLVCVPLRLSGRVGRGTMVLWVPPLLLLLPSAALFTRVLLFAVD